VALIDIDEDSSGQCVCGLLNKSLSLAVALRFSKRQLPWLINWQHWGRGEYVTGLEPSTNKLDGQARTREKKELILLEPGESRTYDLRIEVLTTSSSIQRLKNETGNA
jgi:hypothetical protein